jgi:integrase
VTAKHVAMTAQRTRRMLDLAKARRISDLSLSKALDAVQALRDAGLGQSRLNNHIIAAKTFSRWLWRDGRAREHHLAHLATSSPESDRRHVRRLLSPEEAARVVQAAASGPDAGGLTGPDRAVLYHLALGTGFRRKELATLTPERFNLDSNSPTVTGRSCHTKNGREAIQPLAKSLADRLRPWIAGKAPGRPVFEGMTQRKAEMLRVDLANAGIPYETDSGVVDFHSLRGDFISYLVSSGASVKTCQTLARHSSPTMTIGVYAKASLHDINGAVENLPDLTAPAPQREALRKTGTDATATRNATRPIEVASDDSTQVQFWSHERPTVQSDRTSTDQSDALVRYQAAPRGFAGTSSCYGYVGHGDEVCWRGSARRSTRDQHGRCRRQGARGRLGQGPRGEGRRGIRHHQGNGRQTSRMAANAVDPGAIAVQCQSRRPGPSFAGAGGGRGAR